MKIILTHEVANLGSAGDVVEVKPGYGRNYLLPQGLAIAWTKGGQKQVDSIQRARAAREVHDLDQARALSDQLKKTDAHIVARVGRFESRLDGHRRALLGRARQFLESGGTDVATLDPMARPGRWVARRGVWHWQ